jgi:hypothetical protein
LAAHPPHSYTLVDAGNALPEWVSQTKTLSQSHPWLADLAKLERAFYQAYHAADPHTWDPNWIQQLTPEIAATLKLHTQPSVTLHESEWKLSPLLKKGKSCKKGHSYSGVYREGYRSTQVNLSSLQYQLLKLCLTGARLEEWIQAAGRSKLWLKWLQIWTERGIIYPAL